MNRFLAAAAVSAPGASAAQAKELRLSMAPPPNSPWGAVAQKIVDKVAEISGGALTIKAFMGSRPGGEQDMVQQIARGRKDMGVMSSTAVSLVAPEFDLLAPACAFDGPEQFDCAAVDHLPGAFSAEFGAAGVRTISRTASASRPRRLA